MAIKTVVYWGVPPDDMETIKTELNNQKSIGTTDGSFDTEEGRVVRSWTTVEAAEGWIDFLNSLEQTPASAEVVQD